MLKINLNQAVFNVLPHNNNRTAWRPTSFPIVLTVPYSKSLDGTPTEYGNIYYDATHIVKVEIEGAPDRARVAGHTNIGKYVPDQSLYTIGITYQQLLERQISPSLYPIYDENFEETQDFSKAKYFKYTTHTGVIELIEYLKHTSYYDLSDIQIPTENLQNGLYYLKYATNSYKREVYENQLICIDNTNIVENVSRILINHPGDVISEFYYSTPSAYVEEKPKSEHQLVELYRPFTDILQDIYDEQNYIENANWLLECDEQMLPFLASSIGWEIPYIPNNKYRSLIRQITEIQKLKGSKTAIEKIYKIFGYDIFVNWLDGSGKPVEYQTTTTTDILFSNYYSNKFITHTIPLLYKPEKSINKPFPNINQLSDITIYTIIAKGQAINELESIETFTGYTTNNNGINTPSELLSIDYSQSSISAALLKNGMLDIVEISGPKPPLNDTSVSYNKNANSINITVNNILDTDERLFCYAIYERTIPSSNKTNKFIIQILNDTDEVVDQNILNSINSIIPSIKSYHSHIEYTQSIANFEETYLVNDLCIGGDFYQRKDTQLGTLQVPQAIIPNDGCGTPETLGYKPEDIIYRNKILNNVLNEFNITKQYDNRQVNDFLSNIPIPNKINGTFTPYGQDIIEPNSRYDIYYYSFEPEIFYNQVIGGINKYSYTNELKGLKSSNNNSSILLYCEVLASSGGISKDLNNDDSCIKGRVSDSTICSTTIVLNQRINNKPCSVTYGTGAYYTFPSKAIVTTPGTKKPQHKSKTQKTRYSGGSTKYGQEKYSEAFVGLDSSSFLSDMLKYIDSDKTTLHYSDRSIAYPDSKQMLALNRPSIDIDKPNCHLPGCRFPMYTNLLEDYISTSIKARPWDSAFATECGPSNICNKGPTYLNARLISSIDGESLVFDDEQYIAYGNGLVPDIGNYDDNSTTIIDTNIVHKIYSVDLNPNPAVTLDHIDSSSIYLAAENGGYLLLENGDKIIVGSDVNIITNNPIFRSATLCDGMYKDAIDGYPSNWGSYTWINDPLYKDSGYQDIVNGLGLYSAGSVPVDSKFRYNSGILVGKGLRYDCGCTSFDCELVLNVYDEEVCKQALQSDSLSEDIMLVNNEHIGVKELRYDGSIPSYFELLNA